MPSSRSMGAQRYLYAITAADALDGFEEISSSFGACSGDRDRAGFMLVITPTDLAFGGEPGPSRCLQDGGTGAPASVHQPVDTAYGLSFLHRPGGTR